MGQFGRFLRKIGAAEGHTGQGYAHGCPACEEMHAFAVETPFSNGARWQFDGNIESPTFAPSMNIATGWPDKPETFTRCHYFLRAGQIEFLGDSTHGLAGRTVPLPELPERYRDRPAQP